MKEQGNLSRGYVLNCRLSRMSGLDAAVLLFIWSYATAFYKIRIGDKQRRGIWAYPNQTTIASYLGCTQSAVSKALANLEEAGEIEKVRYLEYRDGTGEILRGDANPTLKRPVRRDTRYLIWNCAPWAAKWDADDPATHQGQRYHKLLLYELREQKLIRDMGEACLTLLALCVDLQPGGSIAVGDRPTDAGKNLYERLTYRTGQTVSAVKRHLTRLTRLGLIHVGTQSRGRAGRFLEATYELNVNYISIFKDDRRSPSGNKSDDRGSPGNKNGRSPERGGPDERKAPSVSLVSSPFQPVAITAGPPEQKPAAPATTEQGDTGLILRSTFKTYGTQALISHFVICGYTWSQWSHLNPRVLHSLVIGLPAVDGKFQCCGLVGGGLRATGRREELYALLKGTEKSPFPDEEEILFTREHPQWCGESYPQKKGIAWVEPLLVARVKFAQFTRRCRLTMPMYQGLRRDLRPGDLSGMLEKLRAVEVGG